MMLQTAGRLRVTLVLYSRRSNLSSIEGKEGRRRQAWPTSETCSIATPEQAIIGL